MQWTEEQRRAIDARSSNILLSAAAGSGKTTVLVGRILDLLASGGTGIDRMLIVTFTRAASADMRMKLTQELGKRAAEGDEVCRSQLLLMEHASITTLHGFCSEFLRTHFERADVDPAFRVLDDAEARRLSDEALDQAIEEAYADPDDMLSALDYGRGPKGVRAMSELMLSALEERPEPEAWLAEMCAADNAMCARWTDELLFSARRDIEQAILCSRLALASPGCNENYAGALEADIEKLAGMRGLETYDEMFRALSEFKQTAAGRKKCGPAGEDVIALRENAKKAIERIALKNLPLTTALADAKKLSAQMERLGRITLRAQEIYDERKAELSALSYSDLERRALRALSDPDTAQSVRESYDYIFVDEYQDTSDVQEALIRSIARENNLFMVGDVKQSIYRFRNAEPGLFLDKYRRYGAGDGGVLLPLTMNFRSKKPVLDFVNRIFERAMHGGASEIIYDEAAHLNAGLPEAGGSAEIHVLQNAVDEDADETYQEYKTCEKEALFIAGKIREMMRADPKLKFRDFAVLTRAKRGVLGRMAAILLQEGIPAYADGTEGFFDSMEIMLALSLLKLIANRRSDVELIGVLRSPVVGLSDEQLARIRLYKSDVPFVDAAAAYCETDDDTGRQLRAFFDRLKRWQLMALTCDLGVLTRTVLDESGFYDCAGALPGGRQRQANLNRLIDNAAQFDRNVSGSLTRFLKHTEKLRARGDGDDAQLLGENDDVVRLMTAHKSKGLEFPVVFGAMLNRRYSGSRRTSALSFHRDLGLGCLYCDPELQTRRKTLPQLAIAERRKREDQAEELRILYVLLTRAKEKLVLVGSVANIEKSRMRWQSLADSPDAAESSLDVIMPAMLPDGRGFCAIVEHDDPFGERQAAESEADVPSGEIPHTEKACADDALVRALLWKYPDAQAANQPLKLTVTGLLRELQGPEVCDKLIERPAFMAESAGKLTGAERGTAYHRAMQCLDLDALRSENASEGEIRRQLDSLAACRRLTEVQRSAVYPRALARFFASDPGHRLLRSDTVRREWPFNVMIRISEALGGDEAAGYSDEEILVQGAIDCCFMENGGWVLLDYKTDRDHDAEALTERYAGQLRMYALALERITGIPVNEIRLCLLTAGESVEIIR